MTSAFGLNILSQYVRHRGALLAWLKAAQPAAIVVMDEPELAAAYAKTLPGTTVIHRTYHPADSLWHTFLTPQQWLELFTPMAVNGVVLQVYNEPQLDDAALTWLEDVCKLCPPDMRLALPNFAVGNPHEDDIMAGKYDRLLKLVCGTRHILTLHEYLKDDPITEAPYLCGRFRYWLKRAAVLGLPAPRIVITEHGRDVGGGHGDGWRGTGWSEESYFSRLQDAQEDVYNNAVPVCIFSWGTGANNDWLSFDIQDAPALQQLLIDWNKTHPIQEVPPVSTAAHYRVNASLGLRLRATPNGAFIRFLADGEIVTALSPKTVPAGGYDWLNVRTADGTAGWCADKYLEAVNAPPTPLQGIDVSVYQLRIDWQKVKRAGIGFAYIRAAIGIVGVDERLGENVAGALAAGVPFGYYNVFLPNLDGAAQGAHAASVMARYPGATLTPAIDVELKGNDKNATAERLYAMTQTLEARIGRKPVIYTGKFAWNDDVGAAHDAYFAGCELWLAQYTSAAQPTLPRCWSVWKYWQYSSSGKVDGIGSERVDLNRVNSAAP